MLYSCKYSLSIGLVLFATMLLVNRSHIADASEGEASTANSTAVLTSPASTDNEPERKEQYKNSRGSIIAKAEMLRKPIDQDALMALKDVQSAIELLVNENKAKALARLQHAEFILTNQHGNGYGDSTTDDGTNKNAADNILTISSIVKVVELKKSNDEIQKEIAYINRLLDEHQTQLARNLISDMRDEAIVNTISMPVATFLSAVKTASEQIKDEKGDLAFRSLKQALDSLTTTETVASLSLIAARDAIGRAMSAESEQRNKLILKDTILYARSELEKAELLGYVKDSDADYMLIKHQINELKDGAEGPNSVKRFYHHVMERFDKMWNKKSVDV